MKFHIIREDITTVTKHLELEITPNLIKKINKELKKRIPLNPEKWSSNQEDMVYDFLLENQDMFTELKNLEVTDYDKQINYADFD